MGTNYYVDTGPPCPTCGRGGEELHVGKQSAGWMFCFAPYPERGLTSRAAWLDFLRQRPNSIRDEYGGKVTVDDLERLTLKTKDKWDAEKYYAEYPEHRPRDGRVADHETKDAEGYRFSRTADFS